MNAFFEVELDRATRSLRLRCFGLWSEHVRSVFEREVDDHMRRYRGSGGPRRSLLTLVDLRESLSESHEMVVRPRDRSTHYAPASAKIAILLAPPALLRTQVQHRLPPDRHHFFLFEEDARAWLTAHTQTCSATG